MTTSLFLLSCVELGIDIFELNLLTKEKDWIFEQKQSIIV